MIERNAFYAANVDWAAMSVRADTEINSASSRESVYEFIRSILRQLGDGHGFLMEPSRSRSFASDGQGYIDVSPDGDGVGYIRIDTFFGEDHSQIAKYVRNARDRIAETRAGGVCKWILDLRRNEGGNMWPMLGALWPLLGGVPVGGTVDRDEVHRLWYATFELADVGATSLAERDAVAVLIGERTASSGEAVAVAFRNRPGTRFFGQPTRGLTTANDSRILDDGSRLFLMTAIFEDRSGMRYGSKIIPNEFVLGQTDVIAVARTWLETQDCLRAP